jgi:Xaa-Pro aminopeptidase
MNKSRRLNVLKYAKKYGCDTVAAFNPENIFYLTGFWGEAIAVCTSNCTKLITPKLELSRAMNVSEDCEIVSSDRGSKMVSDFISSIEKKITCTDCADYSIIKVLQNRYKPGSLIVSNGPFFETRMIKDDEEIKAISKTANIVDTLYEICTEEIKVGVSERELQAKLVFEAMKRGASPPSYKWTLHPLIIAGGPNAALPHAEISDRQFRSGDMIIVDLTFRYRSYIADATRTFGLGTISSDMRKIYNIVHRSQEAGLNAITEGATCGHIDGACRQTIKQYGFDKFFVHSTGHGIGLDIHEPPWLHSKSRKKLKRNMSITVEPGIYIEGSCGVRIEDSVIVDSNNSKGVKNLCQFTKDLIVLD